MTPKALAALLRQHGERLPLQTGAALLFTVVSIVALGALARWGASFLPILLDGAHPMRETLQHAAVGLSLLAILTASTAARDITMTSVAAAVVDHTRHRMVAALVRQPMSGTQERHVGDFVARLAGDVTLLQQSLTRLLAIWLPAVLSAAVLLAACVMASPRLSLATVIVVAPAAAAIARGGERLQGAVRRTQDCVAGIGQALGEALSGAKEAKVFRREGSIHERFRHVTAAATSRLVEEERLAVVLPALVTFLSSVALAALVLLAAWWTRTEVVDAASTSAFLVSLALLVAPLQESMRSFSAVARTAALLDRCNAVASMPVEMDAPGSVALPAQGAGAALELRRATVRRATGQFTLGPISARIEPGSVVAIVGASGSGKSTLLEVIPRLVELTSGEMLVEGVDARCIHRSSLRAMCALVPQEPYFFSGTVRDNLHFALPTASRDALERACRAAHAHEFVLRLPLGYETLLSSGAANLSVGQRQRLAIARALLVDPRLLLLDEPTAALDAESEDVVIASLRALAGTRTIVIATHSAAAMAIADEVIELRHGLVVTASRLVADAAARA